jgi:thioesterase domain-containing protein
MADPERKYWANTLLTNSNHRNSLGVGSTPFFYISGYGLDDGLGDGRPVIKIPIFVILKDKPDIYQTAIECRKILRRFQPEGPYLIGGYCDAGIVAYELSRILMDEGHQVVSLVLVEALFPETGRRLHTAALRLARRLLLSQMHPALAWRDLTSRIEERVRHRRGRGTQENVFLNEYFHNMCTALSDYRVQPYSGRLTLIVGDKSPRRFFSTLGWKDVARGGVEKHVVDGDHDCHRDAVNKIRELLSKTNL